MWSRADEVGAMKCYNDRCDYCSPHHNCRSLDRRIMETDDLRTCTGYIAYNIPSIPLDPIIDAFTEDIMNNDIIDGVKCSNERCIIGRGENGLCNVWKDICEVRGVCRGYIPYTESLLILPERFYNAHDGLDV